MHQTRADANSERAAGDARPLDGNSGTRRRLMDVKTAIEAGDVAALRHLLAANPGFVNTKGGPG